MNRQLEVCDQTRIDGWEKYFSFTTALQILDFFHTVRAGIEAKVKSKAETEALSEKEARDNAEAERLKAMDEAMRSRHAQELLTKEERYRLAQEQFQQSIKIRKKKR